jgi:hypothetical protein
MTGSTVPAAWTAAGREPAAESPSQVLRRLGGWRGLVDGAVPPMVFVAVNATAGLIGADGHALQVAAGAALVTAGALGAIRVAGGHTLSGVLRGLATLILAVAVALWTGQARDFFLPGIYVDASYCVALTATALVGRPAIGYAYAALFRSARGWRTDPLLRRVLTVATLGWAGLYLVRAVTQMALYAADEPELLGLAKTGLGWPLTALSVLWTLRAARLTRPGRCSPA